MYQDIMPRKRKQSKDLWPNGRTIIRSEKVNIMFYFLLKIILFITFIGCNAKNLELSSHLDKNLAFISRLEFCRDFAFLSRIPKVFFSPTTLTTTINQIILDNFKIVSLALLSFSATYAAIKRGYGLINSTSFINAENTSKYYKCLEHVLHTRKVNTN